jgi:hypothetical protein
MSSNYTDFPLADVEYVRAFIVVAEDKIINVNVSPVIPFRVDTDAFQALLGKCMQAAEQHIEIDGPTQRASQQCNYEINQGLAKLEEEGRLFRAQKVLGLMTAPLLAQIGNGNFVETCDGYSVFNSYCMPPVANSYVN